MSIIWNYNGLVPEQMADRIVSITERILTTTVDNIEHIESQSLYGIAVVKVFLQPNASVDRAIAQITAISQTQLRQLPAGTTPPLIIAYSASSVPVMQLALSGQGLSEQQLNDYGLNFIRTQLITVPGAAVPYPYGGKQRQVQVDLNPAELQSKGLSALDVVNAISAAESDSADRHIEDWQQGIQRRHSQRSADHHRGSEPDSDQNGRQYHDLHERRRLGARWISSADQHRSREWPAVGTADDSEGRQRLDAET